jgi:putative transposase
MSDHGLYGLPRPGRRTPNLIGVDTPVDVFGRRFAATLPNELWRATSPSPRTRRQGVVLCDSGLLWRIIVARTFSTTADTAPDITRSTWV